MKSENKLRSTYNRQLQRFEETRLKKIQNLQSELRILQNSEEKLKLRRSQLETALEREHSKTFRSFEDYYEQARFQRKQAKASDSQI